MSSPKGEELSINGFKIALNELCKLSKFSAPDLSGKNPGSDTFYAGPDCFHRTRFKSLACVCLIVFLLAICAGCGATLPPKISSQFADQGVLIGQRATFSVTATGTGLTYEWWKDNAQINGANASTYTTRPTTAADNGSQFRVVVSNSGGSVSRVASLAVGPPTDVLTYHFDNARSGLNSTEVILNLENVNLATFGKVGFYPTDGLVDAQPLIASNVPIPYNGTHNVLVVATENDTLYAFDADTGATIWRVTTLETSELAAPNPVCPTCAVTIGINPTPVIDRTRGPNGAIYVVADSMDALGNYHQRLHALDLALGTELFNGPVEIQATYPGTGDNSDGTNVIFDPKQYRERAGLLLLNGIVYTSWASHYDTRPYTGWIIAYDASTLAQASVLNVTPNGSAGAIWMSGAAPAADNSGNIYVPLANGEFDETLDANGFPNLGDYGNALLKLSTANGLHVADYFEMDNELEENENDVDLGSGGVMLLPDQTDGAGHVLHLAVVAGKDTDMYVVNRDSMGKFSANNVNLYQEIEGVLGVGIDGAPAFFNNTVYYGPLASSIQAFAISNGKLSPTPVGQTPDGFGYPGATPSISANGASNAILWAIGPAVGIAELRAYNATTLKELYTSNQATGGRDQFNGNKFITPVIANGKVFVGTPTGVAVFGLLPQP
jgi:outer membrane protein assembly factor BamB